MSGGDVFSARALGTRQTLWLAAGINLLVAIVARAVDRATPSPAEPAVALGATPIDASPASVRDGRRALAAAPSRVLLAASATVGFAFFLMELVWYRLLGPLLGGSVFTFGLILAVALAGIGIGGLLYALTADDRPASLSGSPPRACLRRRRSPARSRLATASPCSRSRLRRSARRLRGPGRPAGRS